MKGKEAARTSCCSTRAASVADFSQDRNLGQAVGRGHNGPALGGAFELTLRVTIAWRPTIRRRGSACPK